MISLARRTMGWRARKFCASAAAPAGLWGLVHWTRPPPRRSTADPRHGGSPPGAAVPVWNPRGFVVVVELSVRGRPATAFPAASLPPSLNLGSCIVVGSRMAAARYTVGLLRLKVEHLRGAPTSSSYFPSSRAVCISPKTRFFTFPKYRAATREPRRDDGASFRLGRRDNRLGNPCILRLRHLVPVDTYRPGLADVDAAYIGPGILWHHDLVWRRLSLVLLLVLEVPAAPHRPRVVRLLHQILEFFVFSSFLLPSCPFWWGSSKCPSRPGEPYLRPRRKTSTRSRGPPRLRRTTQSAYWNLGKLRGPFAPR